jgi:hypothetical protein
MDLYFHCWICKPRYGLLFIDTPLFEAPTVGKSAELIPNPDAFHCFFCVLGANFGQAALHRNCDFKRVRGDGIA